MIPARLRYGTHSSGGAIRACRQATGPVLQRIPGLGWGALLLLALLLVAPRAAGQAEGQQVPPEAPVVSIQVEGNHAYQAQQLITALGAPLGEPFDAAGIERGIKVLFDIFRVRASVLRRMVLDEQEQPGVELLLRVEELPRDLEPRFSGNVEIDTEELLEWLGIDAQDELFLFQAPRLRQRLIDRYRADGFYFVEVSVVERRGGVDEQTGEFLAPDVIFRISEGPRVHVRDVVLNGNQGMRDGGFWFLRTGLRSLAEVELRSPNLFNWFAKDFDERVLERDVIALRRVYRDFGYLDRVVQVERLEFSDDRAWVTIHIVIDEGERFRVGTLGIRTSTYEQSDEGEGMREVDVEPLIPEQELLELLKLRPGAVYEVRSIRQDQRVLRTRYAEQGYIDHFSLPREDRWEFRDPQLVVHRDEAVVDVTYIISQGRQQFIREIKLRGNLNTRDRVIRRLLTVAPGDIANPQEIARSRARVESTGFFSDSLNRIDHREPTFRFLETDDPSWKDLEYTVEEGTDAVQFRIAGAVASNSGLSGSFIATHRNFDLFNLPSSPWSAFGELLDRRAFHGAGQEITIAASPGTETTSFQLSFKEDDLFRTHLDRIGLTLLASRTITQRFDTHDEDRTRFGAILERQIGPDTEIFLGYDYGLLKVDDLNTGGEPFLGNPLVVPATLVGQEGENQIAYLRLGFGHDSRDNRISPRTGARWSLNNQIYLDGIGSDFEFYKGILSYDYYDVFDDENPFASDRYHIGFQVGVGIPFGRSDDVPYTERFFLGGRRQMRGFDLRGVGPFENGEPAGGETMLFGTIDFRRPLVTRTQPGSYREIETVYGGIFLDVGVLDPDAFDVDLAEVRISAGFLLGISVPLPLTLSFGFPLRKDGSGGGGLLGGNQGDDEQVVQFSIGF